MEPQRQKIELEGKREVTKQLELQLELAKRQESTLMLELANKAFDKKGNHFNTCSGNTISLLSPNGWQKHRCYSWAS